MWWSVLRGGVRYDRIFCMDFGGCDWIDLGVYLLASIDQIVSDILVTFKSMDMTPTVIEQPSVGGLGIGTGRFFLIVLEVMEFYALN